jgi:hypothetical protein
LRTASERYYSFAARFMLRRGPKLEASFSAVARDKAEMLFAAAPPESPERHFYA